MSKTRVLISGASVAGPALAYWLVRAGCQVTVVERAQTLRTSGQGLDVRDTARDVIKQMGIFNRILDRSSHEEGISIVDSSNKRIASVGVDLKSGTGNSMTCDIEILRGELAGILYDVTKDDVPYIFGDMVESIEETDKEVHVTFANATPTAAFDLVVAADGIGSNIRTIAFGTDAVNVRSLNSYVSYFSIQPSDTDSMWARVNWAPGGRVLAVRPDNMGLTRAFLVLTAYDGSDARLQRFAKILKEDTLAQKSLVQEMFQDAGWEISRILKGMHESDDFYLQHVAQVRLNRWSNGRVALVGDAAYAPSPFTGMGTSLAFIGAYVLAGEISRQPGSISAALESYEKIMRPYVESIQTLPPGIPWIVNPQSALGVRVWNAVTWCGGLLMKLGVVDFLGKIAAYIPFGGDYPFKLPEYDAFKK